MGVWRGKIDGPVGEEGDSLKDFTAELMMYGLDNYALQVNMYSQLIGDILMLRCKKQLALQNEEYENLAEIRDALRNLDKTAIELKGILYSYRDLIE